jgi:thiosulfate/3-mercaptopyruvate sulfurtransferase
MPSAGHVPGAVQLEWEELFADGVVTLRPREELARLYAERVGDRREVITYCWIGYRASATWFVARYLGYDAKLYDGSYQDWQLRKLPVVAGEKP